MSDALETAIRDTAIGCPEQFLAVTKLLEAAAEARRSADLIEDIEPHLSGELHRVAGDACVVAERLLGAITSDEITRVVLFAELRNRART
jgi:hypothetical protein